MVIVALVRKWLLLRVWVSLSHIGCRFDNGTFYPGGPEADSSYVGEDAGKGFNINVPWNTRDVGDME